MKVTKEIIVEVAAGLASKCGLAALTRDEVAAALGVSSGAVSYHFSPMSKLREAVLAKAIDDQKPLAIIAEGLTTRVRGANKAPYWLRQKALNSLVPRAAHQ